MKELKYIYKVVQRFGAEVQPDIEKILNTENTSKMLIDVFEKEYYTIIVWED